MFLASVAPAMRASPSLSFHASPTALARNNGYVRWKQGQIAQARTNEARRRARAQAARAGLPKRLSRNDPFSEEFCPRGFSSAAEAWKVMEEYDRQRDAVLRSKRDELLLKRAAGAAKKEAEQAASAVLSAGS